MITDPTDLAGRLLDLQEEFTWPVRAEKYELKSTWERERSGSSFRHFHGLPEGPDIVVKTGRGWTATEAKGIFVAMVDLADTIDQATVAGVGAVRPWAWAGSPPCLVMPFIEGKDLVSILRDPDSPAWSGQMDDWVGRAGAMLAAYHRRHPAPESIAEARQEVEQLAQRLRVRRNFEIAWKERVAFSFGDFGPGNLHATPPGDLYLLDPPVSPGPAAVHRDLANFLFELRRQLAGRGFTPSPALPGRYERLHSGFLRGYAMGRAIPISPGDEALIALYEARRAFGMARKRFPARFRDAMWFGSTALSLRRMARSR